MRTASSGELHYYDDKFPALRKSPARRGDRAGLLGSIGGESK